MKVRRGTKIKICDKYEKPAVVEYPVAAFYNYNDTPNPTIAVLIGPGWLSEFDIITGDHFVWGQGSSGAYTRDKYVEPSQLPLEWENDKDLQWKTDNPIIEDRVIDSIGVLQKSFLERVMIWMLGKFR